MARKFDTIAFIASPTQEAQNALSVLEKLYATVEPENADVIVALGGDGLMLQTLHQFMGTSKPIYGMNKGTTGFLMNEFREDGLPERLETAQRSIVHPLLMKASDTHGQDHT